MFFKKNMVLLLICFLILAGFLESESTKPKSPELFFENLKRLAEDKVGNSKYQLKFENTIGDTGRLHEIIVNSQKKGDSSVEAQWIKKAPEFGNYIGNIVIANLDKPDNVQKIAIFLLKLQKQFEEKNYVTAAFYIYNSIIDTIRQNEAFSKKINIAGLGIPSANVKRQALEEMANLSLKLSGYSSSMKLEKARERYEKRISILEKNILEFDIEIRNKISQIPTKEERKVVTGAIILGAAAVVLLLVLFFFLNLKAKKLRIIVGAKGGFRKRRKAEDETAHSGAGKSSPYKTSSSRGGIFKKKEKNGDNKMDKRLNLGDKIDEIDKMFDTILNANYIEQGELKRMERDLKNEINDSSRGIEPILNNKAENIRKELLELIEEKLNLSRNLPVGKKSDAIGEKMDVFLDKLFRKVVEIEREVLKGMWKGEMFEPLREQLGNLSQDLKDKRFFDLCYALEDRLSFNEDFLSSYKNAIRTLRNYDNKLTKIINIPKIIGEDPDNRIKGPTLEKDLKIIKSNIYFLISFQNTNIAYEILEFNIEGWVKEEFWEFADQFMRSYQRGVYEGKKTAQLDEVKDVIDRILTFVKLEIIRIELGKTVFDSKLHIGRSYTRESSMYDGTIADVVRNGYREINGVVIQQPEVIVNRL